MTLVRARVFQVDVSMRGRCGSRMSRIAWVVDHDVVRKTLGAVGLPTELRRCIEWIWSRTGYGAMPADLQPRHYMEELVEVVDFMESAQLAAFLVRVERAGAILPLDGPVHASREAR